MPHVSDSAVLRALGELAPLGTDRDREQIAALRERLDAVRLRVLVAGEAKRGKSTLINALLGRAVLPDLVTERGNPGNRRRITDITVYLDAPLLRGGVELVDTPGTGSVFALNDAAAEDERRAGREVAARLEAYLGGELRTGAAR
jgi:ribosome biogenesis GTPase A